MAHHNQDGLRDVLASQRPLTADELAPFGVEYVRTHDHLIELRLKYGLPNVVDIGQGLFTRDVGLVFVDDDTGRTVAYVPPDVSKQADDEYLEQREEEDLAAKTAAAAHTLVPPEIAKLLPPLYANEGQGEEALAPLKLFTPWTSWTWYASEYDPQQRLCFGIVVGHEREFGYFSIAELEEIRGPGGLRIERDLNWTPRPLKECR